MYRNKLRNTENIIYNADNMEEAEMKTVKKVLIGVGVVVLLIVGILGYAVLSMLAPTKGTPIEQYEKPQKAVLVIDVQEDYTGTTARRRYEGAEQLITTINTVMNHAMKQSQIPVYVRQEFEGALGTLYSSVVGGGTALKGTPGAQIDARVEILAENEFTKPKGDAFSNPELDTFLRAERVNELYIMGLDGIFCVDKTVNGALNRGYRVTVITDAVVTYFPKQWEKLLQKYKERGVTLITSQEFLDK